MQSDKDCSVKSISQSKVCQIAEWFAMRGEWTFRVGFQGSSSVSAVLADRLYISNWWLFQQHMITLLHFKQCATTMQHHWADDREPDVLGELWTYCSSTVWILKVTSASKWNDMIFIDICFVLAAVHPQGVDEMSMLTHTYLHKP